MRCGLLNRERKTNWWERRYEGIQQFWVSGLQVFVGAFYDPRFTVHQDPCVESVLGGEEKCSVGRGCLHFEMAGERRADRDRDGEGLEFHMVIVDTVASHGLINTDAGRSFRSLMHGWVDL